jgi:hypothetical protein
MIGDTLHFLHRMHVKTMNIYTMRTRENGREELLSRHINVIWRDLMKNIEGSQEMM